MGPIGLPEILIILVIALLLFGPKRLPEFGRTIGKALGEFRRATTDLKRSIDVEMLSTEPTRPEPSTRAASAAAAAAAAPVARDAATDDSAGSDPSDPAEDDAEPLEPEDDRSVD